MSRRTAWRAPGDHRLRLAAGLVCSLGMLAASPLPTAWQHWKYSRSIELPPAEATRLVSIRVPQDVYAHAAPFLADVRVIDDAGAEVPYVLRAQETRKEYAPPYAAAILENSFSPGHYTQIVLDLKKYDAFHSSLRIDTSQAEFMEWVEVAASDDARVWRVVQERAPIFRFPREGHAGTNVVTYSPNNARYLRLRILDGDRKFPVTTAAILATPAGKSERETLAIPFLPAKPAASGQSAWTVDLGSDNLPLREVRFQVGPGEFVREVTLESSPDGTQWYWVGSGEIYRFAQGGRPCEQLSVTIGGTPQRYLRVEIANGNDRPLNGVVPALYIAAQRITFQQKPGRSYRLLYGDSRANGPVYDLERRVSAQQVDAAMVAQAGPEEFNSDWADPRPWTETHKFVLWLAVALAVLLIGYTALQSLRRTTVSSSQAAPSQNDSPHA
jgi:hypothetical protein